MFFSGDSNKLKRYAYGYFFFLINVNYLIRTKRWSVISFVNFYSPFPSLKCYYKYHTKIVNISVCPFVNRMPKEKIKKSVANLIGHGSPYTRLNSPQIIDAAVCLPTQHFLHAQTQANHAQTGNPADDDQAVRRPNSTPSTNNNWTEACGFFFEYHRRTA